jgi:hypothetical protein
MAKFVQTIEFKTTRIDEFTSALDDWLTTTERGSGATRGLQTKDREQDDTYVQIVDFPSYEQAMANSTRPETSVLAETLAKLCDGPPVFRNLNVLREETM